MAKRPASCAAWKTPGRCRRPRGRRRPRRFRTSRWRFLSAGGVGEVADVGCRTSTSSSRADAGFVTSFEATDEVALDTADETDARGATAWIRLQPRRPSGQLRGHQSNEERALMLTEHVRADVVRVIDDVN